MTSLPPPSSGSVGPDAAEPPPTASARMRIRLRPAELEIAEGVPAGEARTLITTFAMVVMGVVGITGAGLTLYVASAGALGWFFSLAIAQLLLALTVMLLIVRLDKAAHRPALPSVTAPAPPEGDS